MDSTTDPPADDGLADHGDRQVPRGAVDLAVNVWTGPPAWLTAALAEVDLRGYPDPTPGQRVAAERHGVEPSRCRLVNGAAEAFWSLAFGLRPQLAACVHPSFTAPEAALRAAGVPVVRVLRSPLAGFALDAGSVPEEADLVVLGRPDNPTGRVEPPDVLAALVRPGRVVVVDEAFDDFRPDARGLAAAGLPGVVCVRSLTKLWGLAGLRVGYVLGPPEVLDRMAAVTQPWPVSAPAIRAVQLLCPAEAERRERAAEVDRARAGLLAALDAVLPAAGGEVWPSPANFVLLRTGVGDLRERLLGHGLAVRRGTFPGLDPHWVRVAVPAEEGMTLRLARALAAELDPGPTARPGQR